MRAMLGGFLADMAVRLLGSLDRAQHAAEASDQAKAEEQEHHPWLGAELAIEPHPDQDADHDPEAELEADRARRQALVHPVGLACGGIDDRLRQLGLRP